MTLIEHAANINKMIAEGHGNLQIFARHGASGDVNPISYGSVTNRVDEFGPFDLEDSENYISFYVGN
jgi:hypothetical protein